MTSSARPPTHPPNARPSPKRHPTTHTHLRSISNHPHTSKVDADSDVASSMRVSDLSRSLPMRQGSLASGASSLASSTAASGSREHHHRRERPDDAHSVRNEGLLEHQHRLDCATYAVSCQLYLHSHSNASTNAGATGEREGKAEQEMSPAKQLASEVRAGQARDMKDRPDSKLSPSSVLLMSRSDSPPT